MKRYLLYAVIGLAAAFAIAYSMARQYGLDPFTGDMALYWAVIAMTGVYITVRVALILENRRKRQARSDVKVRPSGAAAKRDEKSGLDARMEARRERVRRAKERQAAADAPDGETDPDP